jgi:hypothetical protein
MSLCSLSYLGGMLDRASTISCGSDAVTCPVMGRIITDRFFLAVVLCTNWCITIFITCLILRKIERNEFVCNEFVSVLLQIDIIQFV